MPPLVIADLRGGRNGVDSPIDPSFPPDQCVEAINVDWTDGALGRKRGGCESVNTAGGTAFSSGIQWMFRHIPGNDETTAELWACDGAGVVKRFAGGGWSTVTLSDAITGSYFDINGCSLNGKLWLFHKSAQNRSHIWDPLLNLVRRAGVTSPSAAPSGANTGAGAYAATLRYYRTRAVQLNGTTVIRRGEPSASASFTPSGAGTGVIVTFNGAPGESETHWELEASTDNKSFYVLAGQVAGAPNSAVAIGSTFTDTIVTSLYTSYPISDQANYYSTFPSMKFAIADGNRIIGGGNFDTTSLTSSVWYSPVLGSQDRGDDERWVNVSIQKNRLDFNEKDGGGLTGLGGPISGTFWVFKYRRIIRCTPTGDLYIPYIPRTVSNVIGSVNHRGIINAEDSAGNPCVYFWSHKGPYRLNSGSLEYLGRDIEDIIRGKNGYSKINLSATVPCHGLYHPELGQIWWWVATGTDNFPGTLLVLDIRRALKQDKYGIRGGWSVFTGQVAIAYCSAVFSNTIGATVSLDLKPHIGRSDSTIYKADSNTATDDVGTSFQAYVKTRALTADTERLKMVDGTFLSAKAQSGATIRQTLDRDFGYLTTSSDKPLDPEKSETRVIRKFDGAIQSDMAVIQVQLGDPVATSSKWSLESLIVPLGDGGPK